MLSVHLWHSPNIILQTPLLSATWCLPPGSDTVVTGPALFASQYRAFSFWHLRSKQDSSNKCTQPEQALADSELGASSPFTSQLWVPLWPKWVSSGGFQTLSQGQGKERGVGLHSIFCLFWKCTHLLGKDPTCLWGMGEKVETSGGQFWWSSSLSAHEKSLLESFWVETLTT